MYVFHCRHAPVLGPGFWIRFTVHYNLCAGTVLGLGNDEQIKLLDQWQDEGLLGCFRFLNFPTFHTSARVLVIQLLSFPHCLSRPESLIRAMSRCSRVARGLILPPTLACCFNPLCTAAIRMLSDAKFGTA